MTGIKRLFRAKRIFGKGGAVSSILTGGTIYLFDILLETTNSGASRESGTFRERPGNSGKLWGNCGEDFPYLFLSTTRQIRKINLTAVIGEAGEAARAVGRELDGQVRQALVRAEAGDQPRDRKGEQPTEHL
jgi:hypothetical protein